MPSTWPQLVLEHAGISVAAVTGVLAARGKRIDLFGVIVLALVTAFGGGTVRDVLVGDLPPVWLRTPEFLWNASLTAATAFFIVRIRTVPDTVLLVADAGALALFTMIGVRKGVILHFSASVSILLGVITGVAGGILRDVLTGHVPMVFQPDIRLYATAGLLGSAGYILARSTGLTEGPATLAGAAVVFGLRMAAIRWQLSLPVFESKHNGNK